MIRKCNAKHIEVTMRNLVIPLIVCLLLIIGGGSARAELYPDDTLGFKNIVRGLPGDFIDIPVYLSNDSIVSGLSMLFEFDHNMLWPVVSFDVNYQAMLDAGTAPDSTIYQATPAYDQGLWTVDYFVESWMEQFGWYSTPTRPWAAMLCFYNLNSRDTGRILMAPQPVFDSSSLPADYVRPNVPGRGDLPGQNIAVIKFRVNPDAVIGESSELNIIRDIASEFQLSELAEEWFNPAEDTIIQTKSIIPTLKSTTFIVSAPDNTGACCEPDNSCSDGLTEAECSALGGTFYLGENCGTISCGGDPDTNDPPLLAITPNTSVYNIKAGEQVSFTVTASDAELGEVRIWANQSTSLPANANLAPSNPVVGGGGVASGTFSFKPDVSQQGNFSFIFQALDDSGATSAAQTVTVTVAAIEEDVLFTSSADGLAPEGGIPGLNEVMIPINVVTKKILYGIQYDMSYDPTKFELDSIFTSDRVEEWVIYDDAGATPGQVKVVAFGLANDSMVAGSTSAVVYCAFTIDDFAAAGCYPLMLENGRESIDPDPGVGSLEMVTQSGLICVDSVGDVNLDGIIDVADLVSTVAYIIGNYDLSRRQFATADIIVNDDVNVIDLVGIINTIFGQPIAGNQAPMNPDDGTAILAISNEEIPQAGTYSEMAVSADKPIDAAGVELEIQYNPGAVQMLKPVLATEVNGFHIYSLDNGSGVMKVLIHSEHPWDITEQIKTGLSDIIKLPFVSKVPLVADAQQVWISKASVSTGTAQEIEVEGLGGGAVPNQFVLYQNRPNPFNPTTTIDFYVQGSGTSGDNDVKLEVFNIVGQSVKTIINEALPTGHHSVIWDGSDQNGERTASGVYFYRLKVGDESLTRKMVLLK